MERLALIPARGGSKRLPRKNVAELGGRPMIGHVIKNARNAQVFDRIVVSTEDREIGEVSEEYGASVHWRDPDLATDEATVVQVCTGFLGSLDRLPERFCCIYATAAFLFPEDIAQSEVGLDQDPQADVVMGVSGFPIHPFKALEYSDSGYLNPKWPKENDKKSQQYPHFVASNGTFYWSRTQAFLKKPTFYPERLKGFELPWERAVDIDEPKDWELADLLFRAQYGEQGQ